MSVMQENDHGAAIDLNVSVLEGWLYSGDNEMRGISRGSTEK